LSVQVFVIDSICMYPHCTVRIRLLYVFDKYFDFDFAFEERHTDTTAYIISRTTAVGYIMYSLWLKIMRFLR